MNLPTSVVGSGFVARYLDYMSLHEAPLSYHLAALMSMFSTAVERRVEIDRGYTEPLRTNLYVLLLGPPASRKTYCARIAARVFKDAGFPIETLGDDATDEAIVLDMQHKESVGASPSTTVVCEEFAAFIGKKDYKTDLVKWLCRYYDGGPIRRARARRDRGFRTSDSFLGIFGGATPGGIEDVSDRIVGSGLASRLWVVAENAKARWVWKPDLMNAARGRVVTELHDTLDNICKGGIVHAGLGEEANHVFEEWYMGAHRRFVETAEIRAESWAGRRHDHAVKAAVLLHLLDGGDPDMLREAGSRRGIEFVEALEPGMLEAYDALGASSWGATQEKVMALVKRKGDTGIEARHLMCAIARWIPAPRSRDQMTQIVGDLIRTQLVSTEGEGGRMRIIWKG